MYLDQYLLGTLRSIAIGFIVIFVIYVFVKEWIIRKKLPPGPLRLPLIGTLAFHGFTTEAFCGLSRKYGEIFTIYAGRNRIVVLNSLDVIREAFVFKAASFSGRGNGWVTTASNPTKTGLAASDYTNNFRQTKTTVLGILRNLGFGKSKMEQQIQQEATRLVQKIKATKEKAFDPNNMVLIAESSLIYTLLCGEKQGYGDDTDVKFANTIADCFKTNAIIVEYFSFARFLPPVAKEVKTMLYTHGIIMDLIRNKVAEHLKDHKVGIDSDVIHAYIDRHTHSHTGEIEVDTENLVYIVRDLFMAGLETVASSMKWLLVLLANHPEIQQNAHKEIERVIGKDKSVSGDDREDLNYLEAVICEAQRFKTVTPFAVTHFAEYEDTVAGYTIPKGTQILTNLPRVHMNSDTWGDPLTFRPDRFLNQSGKFVRHPNVIPFCLGKRACLGEVLAKQTLLIFTATLIQKFCFCPPEGQDSIDEEGVLGFTYSPKPFTVRAMVR